MAQTRLSDIIEPTVFMDYVVDRTKERSALYQSELVVDDPRVTELAMGGGSIFHMPFWNDLTATESNVGSDDPAQESTPEKIRADDERAHKHFRNQSWASMDLASAVAGDDPMKRVADLVADYWARDMQNTLIASLDGVIADNVANDSGDMVHDVATDAVGAPADAELIGPDAVITAKQTMGDAAEDLTAIAMHSVPYSRLQKLDQIDFRNTSEKGSAGGLQIPFYLGYRVIVDDGCPAVVGTNRITYTSYLLGRGSVALGEGRARVPVEVDRLPATGKGEGQEVLYNRRHFILHPRGIDFTAATVTGKSPTNTELRLATNWNRVYQRKSIRVAFLQTNG